MKRRMIRRVSERGVTLAELMVTLTIIALLTGGIAFAISGFRDKAKKQDAENNTKSLYSAVEAWKNDHSGCPTVEQLKSDGIIGETSRLIDPWNNAYKISCEDDSKFVVRSTGPDGKEGSEDDISFPKK